MAQAFLIGAVFGYWIWEPKVFGDARGYFFESWNAANYREIGIDCDWIQDNESKSRFGVLRGLHFQAAPCCAAMTAVDKCETEVEFACKLNAVGSMNVAAACRRHGVRLLVISTDYVFGGELDRPCHEFDAAGGAHTVCGASKFTGEELIRRHCPDHVTCRISWLYGAGGPEFRACDAETGGRPMPD